MTIQIGSAFLHLDPYGRVAAMQTETGDSLLPEKMEPQPFVQLAKGGQMLAPVSCSCAENSLCFTFENGEQLNISFQEKDGYAVFIVERITDEGDALEFGPYFTSLTEVIGDVVGVVQGGNWAVGVQSLNPKTIAGYPEEYAHTASEYVGKDPVSEISVGQIHYINSAAFTAQYHGVPCSLMQLYCENRSRFRVRTIMNFKNVTVPPMKEQPDAHIAGASFAMFCCPRSSVLKQIGEIEIAEGLPHPLIRGQWGKMTRESMRSYLIAEFRPDNFENLMKWTKMAGFEVLYHPEPFLDWGHFTLRPELFPDGDDSLADYCARAEKEGLRLGLHTLTSFTRTNDAYVSPVPDPRLAVLGSSILACDLSADTDELEVEETVVFETVTTLQTVRIGHELIQYTKINGRKLTGCRRGLWNTPVSDHSAGDTVSLLCDYPYRVYFPNMELQAEYSKRLGDLFAKTGAAQISFDGLEGCASTGEGDYAVHRFCLDCWDHWKRPDVINDASRLHHNLWHMNTRMNWGEPWGAKMREGMIEYRIKNQEFYQRNLLPRMLGWFLIRKADRKFEATAPEDMEWMLSMAAGFDAGFAVSTSSEALSANGCTDELLTLIHDWEKLRLSDAIPDDLRTALRDPKTEWHLEKKDENTFLLYPLFISAPYVCDLLELQPGQPGGADWILDNPFAEQEYEFRMRVVGYGEIHNPSLYNSRSIIKFPCTVKGGQYLWYRKGTAIVTDRNYRPVKEVETVGKGIAGNGQQPFSFGCEFSGEEGPEITVRVFTKGQPVEIVLNC